MPPEQTLELIVLVLCLQHRDVGQGVVGDPEPVGQAIGDHHVNSVVTPGKQQQDHPGNTGQQRQPVQRVQPVRGVWGKQIRTGYIHRALELTLLDAEIGHDEYDCVAREDVVTAVHVLPVDGEAAPGEDGDHPVDYQHRSDVLPAHLLRALVAGV